MKWWWGIYGQLLNHLNFPMVEFPVACSSLGAFSAPFPPLCFPLKLKLPETSPRTQPRLPDFPYSSLNLISADSG